MSLQTLITQCLGERDGLALARAQAERWAVLLEPINDDCAVGEDPGYDDDFQFMREEVNKLSGIDAERVAELAEKLLTQRCKDVRVASYYLWARLHTLGEVGLSEGLSLIAALLEQFGDAVLPARPNSRRMALEWLTSSKVLDSLALYPEVVKGEAEQTVAALVWLEHGLGRLPEAQRPELGALYAALLARLSQSGGVDAVVPQHSASHDAASEMTAPGRAIKSGRDLLDSGRTLAAYLCDQPQGWLAAHRLMKSLRWDTVHRAPLQEAGGLTRLTPPRSDYRAQLKRLYLQQHWSELIDQAQRVFSEGVNHFWLDVQWYLFQALSKQPAPMDSWAPIVARDLVTLIERLPGLDELRWSDGSPFADQTTREWIAQHMAVGDSRQWLTAPAAPLASADAHLLALENDALEQASSHGVEFALNGLITQPDAQQSGRQRWRIRLLMARVAEQYGKGDLALHLLSELDAIGQRQTLADWEPELSFEVKARLLKLLRHKAQRHDADKPATHQRMDALLAALVAIDPVRAAALCP
ncbi:type VI secretion system protein TssA [Pseudomonas sp. NPDC088444]|uniref:type VI secretion system protein TssA n=1 Tax=Pseudomonas sp. NPDC088444 TaxID=3364456 RepID=UPI00384B878C